LVDDDGTVVAWSERAEQLLGLAADTVCGHVFADLVAGAAAPPGRGGVPSGRVCLRSAGGGLVLADVKTLPLAGTGGQSVVLFAAARRTDEWGYGVSLVRAFLRQRRLGIVVHGRDLKVAFTNSGPDMFGGPDIRPGERPTDVVYARHAREVEEVLRQVMHSGEPAINREQRMESPHRPGRQWTMSWSALQLADAQGRPTGVAAVVDDVTAQERVKRHRDLLHRAASRIGFSLDMRRSAQSLADVAVDDLSDLATVDIAKAVLTGEDPAARPGGRTTLIRLANASADGGWPEGLLPAGQSYPPLPESQELQRLQQGQSFVLTREEIVRALAEEEQLVRRLVPDGAHSLIVSPLYARGRVLGVVTAWRTKQPHPFDDADLEVFTEISSRAALGIDNARRYTREHAAAVALQQRLLPRAGTDTPAAQTAGTYRPARGGTGISGDWFDAISLPSLRAAFVVGDVIGHDLPAAATMGQLRTAVQTYAHLELDPSEVLAHVDDLVQRLAAEAPPDQQDTIGATCLYAVYDPTTCECTVASAGHPPPVLIDPACTAHVIDVHPGPPLGVGGAPFQSTTFAVAPGSVLALFTDGLFALERYAGSDGLTQVQEELAALCAAGDTLDSIAHSVVDRAGAQPPNDDIALLLARTRAVDSCHVRRWQFPPHVESVADARSATVRQLHDWGHDDLAFSTELVVSELVTNAIRYGSGPVTVRLILDRRLICEVADDSNTQPRLLRASATDEGGRGLFIIAQCTTRWGCRYSRRGKTIWTEQPLGHQAV
jgi:serine phosphatase RsbU (regulator of sigma subunit)/PAS domain-containing protein/anti-sigma regulatory factor (Ser/Thr protein kinase)